MVQFSVVVMVDMLGAQMVELSVDRTDMNRVDRRGA